MKGNTKQMANEKNLTHKLTKGEQQKGGKKSGEVRREKKIVQQLLEDYLDKDIKCNKKLKKIADIIGVEENQSIKELIVIACLLNTLKKGDIDKLQKLCELLGEDNNTQYLEDISNAEKEVFGNNIYY